MSNISSGFLSSLTSILMIVIAGIWYPDSIPIKSLEIYVKEHLPPALQKSEKSEKSTSDS